MTESTERAAFEAHITNLFQTAGEQFNAEKFFYREGARYFKGWLQSQWEGWQARSSLPQSESAPASALREAARKGLEALELTRKARVVGALNAIDDREICAAIASLRAELDKQPNGGHGT